jgi:hypothetical protein
VHAPDGQNARVISRSRSIVTGRPFNLAVAFEGSPILGRAFAESSFHHFLDYNWDPRGGAQAFVHEPVGGAILREPAALASTHLSVRNVAL